MRGPLLFGAIIVGAGWVALTPAMATSIGSTGFNGLLPSTTSVEKVGYWKRQYRRYGYPAPHAYYPPVYGHSPPTVVYAYPPVVYGYQPAPPAYAYTPPVYGQAPPPAASPSAEEDYGNYPPAEGDYPADESAVGEYPGNGSY